MVEKDEIYIAQHGELHLLDLDLKKLFSRIKILNEDFHKSASPAGSMI